MVLFISVPNSSASKVVTKACLFVNCFEESFRAPFGALWAVQSPASRRQVTDVLPAKIPVCKIGTNTTGPFVYPTDPNGKSHQLKCSFHEIGGITISLSIVLLGSYVVRCCHDCCRCSLAHAFATSRLYF
jgi:hypothetical protein